MSGISGNASKKLSVNCLCFEYSFRLCVLYFERMWYEINQMYIYMYLLQTFLIILILLQEKVCKILIMILFMIYSFLCAMINF